MTVLARRDRDRRGPLCRSEASGEFQTVPTGLAMHDGGALSLVDEAGNARRDGFALCGHVMPSPWFGTRTAPGPDDDLVEGGLLETLRKFEHALDAV